MQVATQGRAACGWGLRWGWALQAFLGTLQTCGRPFSNELGLLLGRAVVVTLIGGDRGDDGEETTH